MKTAAITAKTTATCQRNYFPRLCLTVVTLIVLEEKNAPHSSMLEVQADCKQTARHCKLLMDSLSLLHSNKQFLCGWLCVLPVFLFSSFLFHVELIKACVLFTLPVLFSYLVTKSNIITSRNCSVFLLTVAQCKTTVPNHSQFTMQFYSLSIDLFLPHQVKILTTSVPFFFIYMVSKWKELPSRVYLFSLCLCGSSPGAAASSHGPQTCLLD